MKSISTIVIAAMLSTSAFAQAPSPKVGAKPLLQVKPTLSIGCKLVGTVKGSKLWVGDCVANEMRGSSATTTELVPSAEEKK